MIFIFLVSVTRTSTKKDQSKNTSTGISVLEQISESPIPGNCSLDVEKSPAPKRSNKKNTSCDLFENSSDELEKETSELGDSNQQPNLDLLDNTSSAPNTPKDLVDKEKEKTKGRSVSSQCSNEKRDKQSQKTVENEEEAEHIPTFLELKKKLEREQQEKELHLKESSQKNATTSAASKETGEPTNIPTEHTEDVNKDQLADNTYSEDHRRILQEIQSTPPTAAKEKDLSGQEIRKSASKPNTNSIFSPRKSKDVSICLKEAKLLANRKNSKEDPT